MSSTEDRQQMLLEAIRLGNFDSFFDLLAIGIDTNAKFKGLSPLHQAVKSQNLEMLKILLESGTLVDDADEMKWTPLHRAANDGWIDGVHCLLRDFACADNVTNDRLTPMHLASFRGHDEIIKLLIEFQADANLRDMGRNNALHLAAAHGEPGVVRSLLSPETRLNPRAKNSEGQTVLHFAARGGHADFVRELLMVERGLVESMPDVNATDTKNRTALNYAETEHRHETAIMLRRFGAKPAVRHLTSKSRRGSPAPSEKFEPGSSSTDLIFKPTQIGVDEAMSPREKVETSRKVPVIPKRRPASRNTQKPPVGNSPKSGMRERSAASLTQTEISREDSEGSSDWEEIEVEETGDEYFKYYDK